MKKILAFILVMLFMAGNGYCADQWSKADPEGTDQAADIDALIAVNNSAIDRLLSNYRRGCEIVYASASTLTVNLGECVLSNSDGSVRRFRKNTTNTTVAWTDIDAGAEGVSTTYYLYAVADTDAETFTVKISASSSAPTGCTYYRRLGSFYNDASGNVTLINNDDSLAELGGYESKTVNVNYQALVDGDVVGIIKTSTEGTYGTIIGYSDGTSTPTTERGYATVHGSYRVYGNSFSFPVKKGDYYKVYFSNYGSVSSYAYFVPKQ
jgi:hypothetical protein